MPRRYIYAILVFLIILGVILRVVASGNRYLWQDEAETTINSLQVLADGYPHGTYKGKPIFENASFIESDDPVYQYESTNYYNTKYERNKGWLTYYYQAVFLKIFGFSSFSARLPFILLFPFSLILLYLLTKNLFNEKVALVGVFLYAINYYSILYECCSRYYSLVIFLGIFCAHFFYQALLTNRWKYYILSTIGLVLMFHTHISSAIAMAVFFAGAHIYYHHSIRPVFNKKVLFSLAITVLLFAPWVILTKLWETVGIFSQAGSSMEIKLKIIWAIFIFIIIKAYYFQKKISQNLLSHDFKNFTPFNYLILYIAAILFVKPFVIPNESIQSRLFIESIPIFVIIFSFMLYVFFEKKLWRVMEKSVKIIFFIELLMIFILLNNASPLFGFYNTDWVKKTIEYLDEQNIPRDSPVFISDYYLSFLIHSDYNIHFFWPARKSYIDQYPGEMYFIFYEQGLPPRPSYLRKEAWPDKGPDYIEKIKLCEKSYIDQNIIFYSCSPKNSYSEN